MSEAAYKSVVEVVPAPRDAGVPSGELQQLWFAALRRKWSSLAVIPADPEGSSLFIARALTEIARLHLGDRVKLVTGRGCSLNASARFILDIDANTRDGSLVIVALDPVVTNQAGIPIALSADAALLVVEMGRSTLDAAQQTLSLVGKERFVGCVSIRRKR